MSLQNVGILNQASGHQGSPVAANTADRVANALTEIRSLLSTGLFNPVTTGNLQDVHHILAGLSAGEATRVFEGLGQNELDTLASAVDSWVPGRGLSAADKQALFDTFASQLDANQLVRLSTTFDGDNAMMLAEAMGRHTSVEVRIDFVDRMARSNLIGSGASEQEKELILAQVFADLSGPGNPLTRAVSLLDNQQLAAVIEAARGEGQTSGLFGRGGTTWNADLLAQLQAGANDAWRSPDLSGTADNRVDQARDTRLQASRIQQEINGVVESVTGRDQLLTSNGSPLETATVPSVPAADHATRVEQRHAEFAEQQARVTQLRENGSLEALQLANKLERDYNALQSGLLAADAYHWTAPGAVSTPPVGWDRASELSAGELARYGISENMLRPDSSGFRAELYLPNADNPDSAATPVLAFKGTDPGRGEDWVNNFTQARGERTDYYDRAMSLAVEVSMATDGEVSLTGHSLGGGMASAAAAVTGADATTFNSAGLHPDTAAQFVRAEGLGQPFDVSARVTAYQVEGDILTDLQSAGEHIPPLRAEQLAGFVRAAVGIADSPLGGWVVERQAGDIGDVSGLAHTTGGDFLQMPQAAGQTISLAAYDNAGRPMTDPAAEFVGDNGIVTRIDDALNNRAQRSEQIRSEADAIREGGGLFPGSRARAHQVGQEAANQVETVRELRNDDVLRNAPTTLGESTNRHGVYNSSLEAHLGQLERRADQLIPVTDR